MDLLCGVSKVVFRKIPTLVFSYESFKCIKSELFFFPEIRKGWIKGFEK